MTWQSLREYVEQWTPDRALPLPTQIDDEYPSSAPLFEVVWETWQKIQDIWRVEWVLADPDPIEVQRHLYQLIWGTLGYTERTRIAQRIVASYSSKAEGDQALLELLDVVGERPSKAVRIWQATRPEFESELAYLAELYERTQNALRGRGLTAKHVMEPRLYALWRNLPGRVRYLIKVAERAYHAAIRV